MSTSKNPVSSAILQLAGVEKLPNTGILLSPEAIQLIEKSSAQIQSSTGGEESPGIPSGQPGAQDEGKDASLAKGLFGIVSTVTFGPSALTAITKGKFNPLSALVESFEAFGKPRDPNETLGERYGSLIEESKRSDPNRDVAYGALGTKNSYSLPGTSFTLGISDEDVLGLTKEEAEKNLNVTEFQSTNTQAQRDQAEEDASTVGVGTAAAAAAARGTPPSTDFGFGEMGSTSGSRSDSPTGGIEGDTSGNPGGAGVGAGDESSSAPGHGSPGAWNTGGKIGALIQHLQTGGDVENAETDLGNANVPMGVVDDPDGAPSPFSGGTGVEDDLDMDVEAGSYVLNAEAVQLIGISDINAVIRDAYSIAAALGQPMPQDYDPQNKVPIRISNGEAVIPKALVDIIGLDKLEKWNQKGLELRKQKEEFMAKQQQQQPPQQQQIATEAPMQQQMQQLMANGTLVKTVEQLKEAETQEARDFFRQKAKEQEEAGTQVPIKNVRNWIREQAKQVEPTTAANLQRMFQSGEPINKDITVKEVPDEPIESIPVTIEKQEAPLNKYNTLYGHGKYRYLLPKGKEITDMTISEIYNLQDSLRKETQDKSLTTTAVGGPQFLQKTIKDLLSRNKNITEDTLFTPDVQNQLTKQIFKEEKVYAFIENPIKKGQNLSAVQYNLAGRFASLPLKNGKSYHKGQKPAMTSDEFRKLLLQVQKLGTEKGIPLLIESIINAETKLRK